jgi:hypothetical protein
MITTNGRAQPQHGEHRPEPGAGVFRATRSAQRVLAEAEDLAAELAIAVRMEAKWAQLEVERLSEELNEI